jgi:DNA mismatch endonuclease (patch repair protein)
VPAPIPSRRLPGVSGQRSALMSRVKGKGNASTEGRVQGRLIRFAIRGWKKHPKHVEGCPDFFFDKERIAVFVDGCFWHGCPRCDRAVPKTRSSYWRKKIDSNRRRDRRVNDRLRSQGISVVRIWEHDVRSNRWLDRLFQKIDRSRSRPVSRRSTPPQFGPSM